MFRRNGVQCKAPAETGSQICHAHAGQLAMAVRRERERRAVLAEAVAEMGKRGKPECEMADLFTSFKGIQVTTAVMARAVITGKIDCKTGGQMVVHLQTMSKLLWQIHRKGRKDLPLIHADNTDLKKLPKALTTKDTKKHEGLPQICADERGLKTKNLPLINTDNTDLKKLPKALTTKDTKKHEGLPQICANEDRLSKPKEMMTLLLAVPRNIYRERAADCDGAKILPFKLMTFGDRCWAHGPPESKAA
ncbi:MAG TPA: hypothetical protein VKU42_05370 [Candidatus Angelobacter sp.]|nr:hypothetical protein [Candidatus Angelobacter sp.]